MSTTDNQYTDNRRPDAVAQLFAPYHAVRGLSVEGKALLAIFTLLALWIVAILSFGWPALILPMKVLVPLAFVMLFLLTWHK